MQIESWQQPDRQKPALQASVEALQAGQLVVFPTETTYVLAATAWHAEATERLASLYSHLCLVFDSVRDLTAWVPDLTSQELHLARKCWPGPVNLVTPHVSLDNRIASAVRDRAFRDGQLELAAPDHPAIATVGLLEGGPLLAAPIPAGTGWACRFEDALTQIGDNAALAIDDGACPHAGIASAIRAGDAGWEMVRVGVIPPSMLTHLDRRLVVFVCTGNTCRSPMAEALFKKAAADRLGCTVGELSERGIVVRSAGLSAMMGFGAAREAQETVRELGGCLDEHQSQPLSRELACEADLLLAMTQSHLRQIEDRFGHWGVQGRLLNETGEDIADPIGNDLTVYRSCAAQIQKALEGVLPEVLT